MGDRVHGLRVLGRQRDDGGRAEHGEPEPDEHGAAVPPLVPDRDRELDLRVHRHGAHEEARVRVEIQGGAEKAERE